MKTALAVVIALSLSSTAHAGPLCQNLEAMKGFKKNAVWTPMTSPQWQFLRGIFAMAPTTPPGLPFGDKAMLVTEPGNPDGVVVFVDGDLGCTPLPTPKVLIDMLADVAAGKINHEGSPL
jgi:hypothetical protein